MLRDLVLEPAVFVERINRFLVLVKRNGNLEAAHLPNSGRMWELLVPGAPVVLRKARHLSRKTVWDLLLVWYKGGWVSVDSRLPNQLIIEAFREKRFPSFRIYDKVRTEAIYGKSRFDFLLESHSAPPCFVEVKSVNLVKNEVALFPDAPTYRGSRHLLELITAKKEGFRSAVIFVVQRDDAQYFSPHRAMDAEFAKNLKRAHQAGVEILAYTCTITPKSARLKELIQVVL